MSQSHRSFAGSIPENYQAYLVPLIFEDYAADLVARLDVADGASVLETACGTGVVTGQLLRHHVNRMRLIATDLNPGMIEQARAALGEPEGVTFETADATDLPFEDGTFDAVICQFGVMFYPDKAKGYREAARVLKPGGQYLFNVWDSLERNPLPRLVHNTVGALFPDDPPGFLELPFGYHDLSAIFRALQDVGFGAVELAVLPRPSRAPSARHVARALCAGSPLANELAQRPSKRPEDVSAAVERAVVEAFGDGPVESTMQAIRISARKVD